MPRVAILSEAVHEQHRRSRTVALGRPLSNHGERDGSLRHDDFLAERRRRAAVDHLFDGASVENHECAGVGLASSPLGEKLL